MIYLYWFLAVPTGALALLVMGLTLTGQRLSSSTPGWLSFIVSAVVLVLVGWGYTLATKRRRPGVAILLTVLSWVFFVTTMAVYGLMTIKIWN